MRRFTYYHAGAAVVLTVNLALFPFWCFWRIAMSMADKLESLRRAVQYGLSNGKKTVVVELNVLQELFRRADPVPRPRATVEDLESILNSEEKSEVVVQPDGSIKAETFDSTPGL